MDKRFSYVIVKNGDTDENGMYLDKKDGVKKIKIRIWYYQSNDPKIYKYRTAQKVYYAIEKDENIQIDGHYIKNFSLKTFRELRLWFNSGFNTRRIYIKDFSAIQTFFDGKVDFSYSIFNDGNINFLETQFGDGDINFSNAKFEESVFFMEAQFGNGDVDFSNTEFKKPVFFMEAQFGKGKISFREAKFGIRTDFSYVQFGDGVVDFFDTKFYNGSVGFNHAKFGTGNISFVKADFGKQEVSFIDTHFGKGLVDFRWSQCEKAKLKFINSKIDVICFDEVHFDSYVDFNVASCNFLSIINTIVRDVFDIGEGAKFEKLYLINAKIIGKMYIKWKENNLKEAINSQTDTTHRQKAEQFLILKENFRNIGRYDDEDKAYFEFKYHELRADKEEGKIGLWEYEIRKLIFEKIGGYGTKLLSVGKSMLWVWLGSSLAYIFLDFCSIFLGKWNVFIQHVYSLDLLIIFKHIGKAFYHSAITFLTIGYGNIYDYDNIPLWANFAIKLVSGIEGFFGLFLMAFFVVAYARKVLR